jgi:ElaB/YqjD/DUF883 family membrane-anchored ribosome-binding protein
MTSSAKLQNQADQARAGLSTALDELRSSVTTTALTNGAMTFAKDGSSAVAKAAIDKAMANPLGAMLIGAGLFMLMSTDKSSGVGSAIATGNSAVKDAAGAVGGVGSKLMDAATSALGATRSVAGSAVDTAKSAAGQVSSTATSAADMAKDSYAQAKDALSKGQEQSVRTMHDAQDAVMQAKTRLEQFAAEQPILVAALGVAFGAALGASLPVTAAERSYMGDASKKLVDKGTDIAKKVADTTTGTLSGQSVSGKLGEVADAVTSTLKSSQVSL